MSCMHRILVCRVLYNKARSPTITNSVQVWDGKHSILHTTHNLKVNTSIKEREHSSIGCFTSRSIINPRSNQNLRKLVKMASKKERISEEGNVKRTREFVSPLRPTGRKKKSKGLQESDVSNNKSPEPEIIILDDIPLPHKETLASQTLKKKKKSTKSSLSMDFIPLPSTSPPPLPPPLPLPPPPPDHTEMDEVIEDFFVIDTTATTTMFPVPLPPHCTPKELENDVVVLKSNVSHSEEIDRNIVNSNHCDKRTHSMCESDSDLEEISVVYSGASTLHDKFNNISLENEISKAKENSSKSCNTSNINAANTSTTSTSSINNSNNNENNNNNNDTDKKDKSNTGVEVIFDGPWPWVMKSPKSLAHIQVNSFLIPQIVANSQLRHCHHSTNQGLKTKEKTPEVESVISFNDTEPEIISLQTGTVDSMLSRGNSENFISLNTTTESSISSKYANKNEIIALEDFINKEKKKALVQDDKIQNSSDSEEFDVEESRTTPAENYVDESKINALEDFIRKEKTKKKVKDKMIQSSFINEPATWGKENVQSQSSNYNFNRIGIVDPDIVEIDNNFPSSSNYNDIDFVDVFESDEEIRSTSVTPEPETIYDDVYLQDHFEVTDMIESDNESVCSFSSGGHEEEEASVDVSNNDYISCTSTNISKLRNKTIDLEDEVIDHRKHLESLRQWNLTGLGEKMLSGDERKRKNDVMFTILSYNLLAQQLLTDNKYLYKNCDESHLDWKYRWVLLQHEIEGLDPDILLLQEVQASHYLTHYLPWFTLLGYDGMYKKRSGTKCDGCAIFYKKSKFSLIEQCSVEYYQPKNQRVLDRDNVGIIAKLSPVDQPDNPICVATTHLLYNPKRHDVKLAQTIVLLTELDRLCYEGERNGETQYCPLIISGDFNAEPHTAVLDFMKQGRLNYEGLSSRTLNEHGRPPYLGSELISPSLGITDRCQHAVLAQSRFVEQRTGQLFSLSDKRKIEESLIHLDNNDRINNRIKGMSSGVCGPMPTGWFSHNFNFNSVYRHYYKRAPEATTFHNKWTTVDYIFYSRIYSHVYKTPVEGRLKLVGRYTLLTGNEADMFSPLPSAVCPSDHFPLAAQFVLRAPYVRKEPSPAKTSSNTGALFDRESS